MLRGQRAQHLASPIHIEACHRNPKPYPILYHLDSVHLQLAVCIPPAEPHEKLQDFKRYGESLLEQVSEGAFMSKS